MSIKNPTLAHFRHSFNYNIFPDTLYFNKQSQFDGGQNEHKLKYEKQLQDYIPLAQAKKQSQFKANKAKNKPNKAKTKPIQTQFEERPKMLEFTLDVSSLALEFTLGCAYLFFCRGSGAFAWIRSLTIILEMLLADFTTLKGANFKQEYLLIGRMKHKFLNIYSQKMFDSCRQFCKIGVFV